MRGLSHMFDSKGEEAWQDKAICKGSHVDPDWWHDAGQEHRAIYLCGGCPVRSECLDYALRGREAHGVWGGANLKMRKAMLRRRFNSQPSRVLEARR